jgi:polysaccharide deacetylase 2 family uncharacterized protein YibQ
MRSNFLNLFLAIIIGLVLFYIGCFKRGHSSVIAEFKGQSLMVEKQGYEEDELIQNLEDDGKPVIALMIGELGFTKASLNIDLPVEVGFGFASFDLGVNNQDERDILMKLPLEEGDDELNPNVLASGLSAERNLENLEKALNKLGQSQGVYSSDLEQYSRSVVDTEALLLKLKSKDLLYLCAKIDKNALIYQVAEKINFPILANDVILDESISADFIGMKLIELEKIAQERGYALAVGGSYPLTIDLLQRWIPSLLDKNIRLVSIGDFYKIIQQRKLKNIKVDSNE